MDTATICGTEVDVTLIHVNELRSKPSAEMARSGRSFVELLADLRAASDRLEFVSDKPTARGGWAFAVRCTNGTDWDVWGTMAARRELGLGQGAIGNGVVSRHATAADAVASLLALKAAT